jgi:hypothetical protein
MRVLGLNTLEKYQNQARVHGSEMTVDKGMIHLHDNLTSDYELQMVILEKRIGNKKNRLKFKIT